MSEERKYEPTPKQRLEAQRRGQFAYSADLVGAAVFLFALIALSVSCAGVFSALKEQLVSSIYKALGLLQEFSAIVFVDLLKDYVMGGEVYNIPALVAVGSTTILSTIMKHFDILTRIFCTTSFADFKKYIIAEQYKSDIEKRIRGGYNV